MAFGGDSAENYYDDGLTAAMKGELARAIECFEAALRKDSSFLAARHQLGKCRLRLGDTARAIADLSAVVERSPDKIPFRLDLGHAYLASGSAARAREQFEWALSRRKDNARALTGLAQAHFAAGAWMDALECAHAAVDTGGPNFPALFVIGRAGLLAGEETRALEALGTADALLNKSLELNPEQPEGYYLRGEVALARKQYAVALKHFQDAEARARADGYYGAFGENFALVDILAKQGLCFRHLGEPGRARELGKKIVSVSPDHALGRSLAELQEP